ncbi:cobalamin B12-binding domain-containing protein [Chloroflexota bacterium]
MSRERPTRILMAKPGLDGHDRGIHVLIFGLIDEGMEVVYTGLMQTPEMIAQTALEEDVDVVGLSSLSGAHDYHFPEVVEQLRKRGIGNVLVIGGGSIPKEDIPLLLEKGISAIFGPGTSIKEVANYIRSKVKEK